MRCRFASLSREGFPLLLAICAGGCATVLDGPSSVRIRSDPVPATVRDERGRVLGTTPLDARLRPRESQRLVISAPGHDSVVVTIGSRARPVLVFLLNPFSWVVDAATGAWLEHDPKEIAVTLAPAARDSLAASDSLPDEVAALVLSAFADAAEEAGCEPLLVGAWRDAALVLGDAEGPPPSDSTRAIAAEEVRRVAPEVRSLCARRTPRLERLRRIREELERGDPPVAAGAALFAPVYFDQGRWEIGEDSVRERLRALGRALAEQGMPETLRVEGFTDASGPEGLNPELGHQRALAVIRELRRGGLAAGCCVAVSHGAAAASGLAGADARLDRRVSFSLDYREP